MKVLLIHNRYRIRGGEETIVDLTAKLLRRKGIDIFELMKNSNNLESSLYKRLKAFVTGVYSLSSFKSILHVFKQNRPDIVHVHNLYPLFSPSVLAACRKEGIPVVMTCHNYRLVCPRGQHLYNDKICELCCGGNEYWCILKNCRGNILESITYALYTATARRWHLIRENVDLFIVLTSFAKQRLVNEGFKEKQMVVVPNMVSVPDSIGDPGKGEYVAYAGRLSPEKGIDILFDAASSLPELRFQLAGEGSISSDLLEKMPINAEFPGHLDREQMTQFYRKARFLVFPSKCFEGCPMVIIEAMSHGLPVIAAKVGGLSEIVEDGVTGLLYERGNAQDLANKMELLWNNQNLCREMGLAGREKVIREYSEDIYYRRLMEVYKRAIEMSQKLHRKTNINL